MRFTVFFSFFTLTLLMIVVFGRNLQTSYYKKSMEQKVNTVRVQCNMLANQVVSTNFIIKETDNLNVEVNQLANVLGGRILIMDGNFKIIKDSYTLEQNKFLITEDVVKVMRGEPVDGYKKKKHYVEVLVPITDAQSKNALGVIVATVSTKDMENTAAYIVTQSQVLYTLFGILAFVFSVGMASFLTKDFKIITQSIQHMADGHMDESIPIQGYTEMRGITKIINEITGKMQTLENSRQEFVSNVSHELKTPITSMKVLADSLLSQEEVPAELYREFMVDIVDEIDRENKIINDLLDLVKMDKKASDLNITMVNINDLLELLLKRLRPLAAKRNIEIVFESFRPVSAEIDEVKLSLAISNLIENAIKYNIDNGWIRVSLNADHKFFYVKVADSGIGIPEDSQEHIFDRFYRVDKARSRETGGTGLGLSITRNAILMHKGAIKVYSKEGEGTTFTIRVPLTHIV